ncbi:MAG: hypothetical protein DHS20C16_33060 [Phycisphaerae bacterium]|nr:MAG: hypothetical protein DHS20C16_33060 [Phycisphaerae bacterium]
MHRKNLKYCWAIVLAGLLICGARVDASEIDFEVGLSDTEVPVLTMIRPSEVDEPYVLARIASGEFEGHYMNIEPGWDGLAVDRPNSNVNALGDMAEVALERISFDAAFTLYDIDGNEILMSDGDTRVFVGDPETEEFVWHEHLLFGVDPGSDPSQTYSATFRFVDSNGVYGASEDFTLVFQPLEPQSCGGGGCGAIGMTGLIMSLVGLTRFRR